MKILITITNQTLLSRPYGEGWACPPHTKISRKSLHTLPVVPAMIYTNADLHKESILNDNRGKAGVYRWTNKENGKTYIGSAVNFSGRFLLYYSLAHISKSSMTICKALLKYGYSNFQLEILEYCEANKAVEREQYYLDICNPEYNILKVAGSTLGYKHTEETLVKFRGRTHSEKTRAMLSKSRLGVKLDEDARRRLSARLKGVGGIQV